MVSHPLSQMAQIIAIGGANMDLKVQTLAPATYGTSNPGRAAQTPGGVARNVAENLARLGVRVALLSAVGTDALGDGLLRQTAGAGVDVSPTLRLPDHATGTYTAVLDSGGELLIAVAAMEIMAVLTPAALAECGGILQGAVYIVADGNLPPDTLLSLLAQAEGRVVFEPVSVPKAARLLGALDAGHAPWAVTPNLAELAALVGATVPDEVSAIRAAALNLHGRGVEVVWVRRGVRGSMLSVAEKAWELPAFSADVVDVTGAGDAMLGAFLAALLAGEMLPDAAREGHAAAALTVESPQTVVPDLTREAVRARLTGLAYPVAHESPLGPP
ncbi:carbohydrate kinase family protein [Deinococcus arenicola]|uniref:Carbohydrate kinase family protein n=1 Tax=Deinococcus arenicola TaxID=2994950 RepID=A0ABU4DMD0_9DEIO|nr:carbohydrate kinase family protein [Deinococcus sp. ZS9-10]MDV6373592.1 carbohydrate kinase family protein [Deinococcus sp. ZS9-10]